MAIGARLRIGLAKIGERVDGHRMAGSMGMLIEISAVAVEAIAGTLGGIAVGAGPEDPGHVGMTLIARAVGGDRGVMDAGDNVPGMAAGAVGGRGLADSGRNPVVVLHQMVDKIDGIGTMAGRTGGGDRYGIEVVAVVDRSGHFRASAAVTEHTVAAMGGIDPSHGRHPMASATRSGRRQHIMLGIGRRQGMVHLILNPMAVGAILGHPGCPGAVKDGVDNLLPGTGMTLHANIGLVAHGHDVNNPSCPWLRTDMARRAQGMVIEVGHVSFPRRGMADVAIGRRIIKGTMGRFDQLMDRGFLNQIVFMATLAGNVRPGLTGGDRRLDIGHRGAVVDTLISFRVFDARRRANAAGIGMAGSAVAVVDVVEAGEIPTDMALFTILQDIGCTVHVRMGEVGMLQAVGRMDPAPGGMTALAVNRGADAPGGDSILNLLERTAMAGLAIGAMGGVELREPRISMASRTIGALADIAMEGGGVVGDAGIMADGTFVYRENLRHLVAAGAAGQGHRRLGPRVAVVAAVGVVETEEQVGISMAANDDTAGGHRNKIGMIRNMAGRGILGAVTAETGGRVGHRGNSGDHLRPVALMAGGAGARTIGRDVVESLHCRPIRK